MIKLNKNSLFFKLVIIIVVIVTLSTTLTLMIALLEQGNRYINSLSLSTLRIIDKSLSEMRDTGEVIIETIHTLRSNWAFREYFTSADKTLPEAVRNASSLANAVDSLLPGVSVRDGGTRLVAVGTNGATYLTNHDSLNVANSDLLNADFTASARMDPSVIHYQFIPQGFTEATSDQSALLASVAVAQKNDSEPYAYIYVIISQAQLRNYYWQLASSAVSFALIDANGIIVSSLDDDQIGENSAEILAAAISAEGNVDEPNVTALINGRNTRVMSRPVKYWGLHLVGFIDGRRSDDMRNAIVFIILTSVTVAALALIIVPVILRRVTTPLRSLVDHMSKIKSGDFSEELPVEGEYEVRELIKAYDIMMNDINNYIRKLIETEDKKRVTEISALQMRIKPHFIYNTLTSIKWLMLRGETKKSAASLDSFALLIKSMLSGDMLTTAREEVENLRHYVLLQQIRFGDQISVEFNIDESCMDIKIPKMIIQPFIENSFFHAYPDGQRGVINLFINVIGQRLIAEIIDDGVGFAGEPLNRVSVAALPDYGYTGGIGMANANERIRLLFGDEYGVVISSERGKGTSVRLTLPLITS